MILTVTGRTIEFPRRPLIMGIVNINDDSFAGDGSLEIERAVATAQAHVLFGADIIDVGGESARTNRSQIDEGEESARIMPFIDRFRECYAGKAPVDGLQLFPPLLSINTWRPKVAEATLRIGDRRKVRGRSSYHAFGRVTKTAAHPRPVQGHPPHAQ